MRLFRLAACCAILGSGLAGCLSRGPLIAPSLASQAQRSVELTDTPFFAQRALQCGPASLAMMLKATRIHTTPDELEPLVYLPQRHGSLQVEMQAAPRKFARLSYLLGPNLSDIVAELDAGRPVLVLHNYGLPFLPRWHYAVVIGYDTQRDSMLLRSGTTERQVLSARNFMRAWDNGGRWAMAVLIPGELPAGVEPVHYFEAAAAFEHVAQPRDAGLVFDAAVKKWPNEPIGWIGRGTAAYRAGDLHAAAKDYAEALKVDPAQNGARNNLAMTLLELDCPRSARTELERIDVTQLTGPLADATRDTRAQIEARGAALDAPSCEP